MAETMSFQDSVRWTRDVFTQWRHWTRAHWRLTLLLSALAFLTGWAWNTYAMAVGLEGSEGEGTKTITTADGHSLNALFWVILFTFVSGVITYAWTRGWTAFRADVAVLPRRFAEAMTQSRPGAFAMLLWGMAVALVIATLISSAAAIVLSLALLALATSPVGVILNFALVRVWRGLCGILAAKARPRLDAMVNPFMVMFGESIGLLLDGLIGNWVFKFLGGIFAALVSVTLARGSRMPGFAVILAFVVAAQTLRVRGALADDGGWTECVTSDGRPCAGLGLEGVLAWFQSDGATHVLVRSSIGAIAAALGALLGLGLGAAGASAALSRATPRPSGPGDGLWPPRPFPSPEPPITPPPEPRHRARSQPSSPPRPQHHPQPEPFPQPDHHRQPEPHPLPDHHRQPDHDPPPEPRRPGHLTPQPEPSGLGGPDHGTVYRASTYDSGAADQGHVYRSASAPAPGPARGVHPIGPPDFPPPGQGGHQAPAGRGNPWDDLDDFLPDSPERQNQPPRRPRRRATEAPEDDGPQRPPHQPRPPTPPRRS
ncbi:hypothetical protein [Paractinoplanes atraurantiacus]|uniref:Uncharacterized protein n=1 Tax=Paractinoplanes atraurantiacus TaxID=1036182 RepID=A0A285IKI1_9ACTN|nr:hypothetical protein [Actinoplanes atraurantiacus]SNY48520.1 hypothetical protein SAMN05421748_10917 [Actinoplanes atraurantiacus]